MAYQYDVPTSPESFRCPEPPASTQNSQLKQEYISLIKNSCRDIVLDEHGELLKKYLDAYGFNIAVIRRYEDAIWNTLPTIMSSDYIYLHGNKLADNQPPGKLFIDEVDYMRPDLTPMQARDRLMSYTSQVYATKFRFQPDPSKDDPEPKPIYYDSRKVHLFDLNVMMGSSLSHTHCKTPFQMAQLGECELDKGNYFIVNGSERNILLQEKVRKNKIYVWHGEKKLGAKLSKTKLTARMTCQTIHGSSVVLLKEGDLSDIDLSLPFLGKDGKKNNSIPVYHILRILGTIIDQGLKKLPDKMDKSKLEIYEEERVWSNTDFITEKILSFVTYPRVNEPGRLEDDSLLPIVKNDVWLMLQPSIVRSRLSRDDFLAVRQKMNLKNIKPEIIDLSIVSSLLNELFPQIHGSDIPTVVRKYEQLCLMIARLTEVMSNHRAPDDRDSWANKRLESAGAYIEQLFNGLWGIAMRKIQENISSKMNNVTVETTFDAFYLVRETINNQFRSSFTTPNWGIKGSYFKENVTDLLKRDNFLATLSHERRANTPASRKMKNPRARSVHSTQYGMACVSETPEGENIGLVKSLGNTTILSIDRNPLLILQNVSKDIISERSATHDYMFILNGLYIGWCELVLHQKCLNFRRSGLFPHDTSITLDYDKTLNINCDSARSMRPLLITTQLKQNNGLEATGRRVLVKDTVNLPPKYDFEMLMAAGAVEFVDAWEQEFVTIAFDKTTLEQRNKELNDAENLVAETLSNLEKVRDGKVIVKRFWITEGDAKIAAEKELTLELATQDYEESKANYNKILALDAYTHCELDPTGLMSYATSTIPWADHNQAPRNSLQAAMAKQALGIPEDNYLRSFHTNAKILLFPERPITVPQMHDMIGLDKHPQGQHMVVGITKYFGWNQEDAFIFNYNVIANGELMMVNYIVKRAVLRISCRESLGKPELKNLESAERYSKIDVNGLPRLGATLDYNDCIIGKIRRIPASDLENSVTGTSIPCVPYKTGKREIQMVELNESIFVGLSEDGTVDAVLITTNESGDFVVKVRIRQVKKLQPGDKLASRYAQKGTIGIVVLGKYMPYIAFGKNRGLQPDILINPLCIPSRMTMGKLIEQGWSKSALTMAKRINATSFRPVNTNQVNYDLSITGYVNNNNVDFAKEEMRSGITGELLKEKVSIGVIYYQLLKHLVDLKIQIRTRGPINPMTHQPLGGRTKGRAQRVGEMEKNALLSHAASALVRERLKDSSDAYNAVFCYNCGTFATVDVSKKSSEAITCRTCDNKKFGTMSIPYVLKLLFHLLWAAGYDPRLILKPSPGI